MVAPWRWRNQGWFADGSPDKVRKPLGTRIVPRGHRAGIKLSDSEPICTVYNGRGGVLFADGARWDWKPANRCWPTAVSDAATSRGGGAHPAWPTPTSLWTISPTTFVTCRGVHG